MPNELQLSAPGDAATLYAIVRRASDGYVWDADATAWATWSDGDLADYAVTLTSQGGDLYAGDFPSTISVGTDVRVHYYRQAGASPATDDLMLAAVDRTWTGDGLDAGGDIAVDDYALTTLASAKRQLNLTTSADDDLLAELINASSGAIERYCGRHFIARSYRQWLPPAERAEAILDHYPVAWIDRFATGAAEALSVHYTGSAIRATAAIARDSLRLVTTATGGASTTSTLSFESHGSTAALATAINALDGWSATLVTDVPTLDLHRTTGVDAMAQAVSLTWPDRDDTAYRVDFATGLIAWSANRHASWRQWGALVQYHAGYTTVPADVRHVCNQMVAAGYRSAKRDSTVKSEQLGDYRYTVAAPGAVDAALWTRLDRYREAR